MRLILLTPVKTLFDGDVESVSIPGTKGLFTVLPHHAPLVTTIEQGKVTYVVKGTENVVNVADGFADVINDVVTICVEKELIPQIG